MDPDPSSLFNTFLVIDFSQVFGIVVLLLLLICSALISGSEVALFSLTPSDFDVKDGNVSAKQQILIRLLDRPKKLLATILVANNFVNIAVVLLFESLGDMFFGDIEAIYFGINLRFVIEVVLVTFLILLFGVNFLLVDEFPSFFPRLRSAPLFSGCVWPLLLPLHRIAFHFCRNNPESVHR